MNEDQLKQEIIAILQSEGTKDYDHCLDLLDMLIQLEAGNDANTNQ